MFKLKKVTGNQLPKNIEEVEEYLTPEQLQKYCKEKLDLKYSLRTFEQWRSDGKGPRYMKPGKRVIYPAEEVDRWAKSLTKLI
jgi:hypothetical protein